MSRRKDKIDWVTAQKLYRIGQLSVREIARQVGVKDTSITRRAEREGWERDAAEEVRKAAAAMLLSSNKAASPTRADIEAAAATSVAVVRGHQKFLGKMGAIGERLADWMLAEAAKEDPAMPKIADAFVKCSQAGAKFIPLERQAFGIDKASPGEDLVGFLKGLDAPRVSA